MDRGKKSQSGSLSVGRGLENSFDPGSSLQGTMPSNLARASGVLGVRTADKDGKSFSHGVVAACRNLPAAHLSEVRGLPVVMDVDPVCLD